MKTSSNASKEDVLPLATKVSPLETEVNSFLEESLILGRGF